MKRSASLGARVAGSVGGPVGTGSAAVSNLMATVPPPVEYLSLFTNKGVGQPSIAPWLSWPTTRIGKEIGCGVAMVPSDFPSDFPTELLRTSPRETKTSIQPDEPLW
jgi:hypothetical protein